MTDVLAAVVVWSDVCSFDALIPGRGRAALIGDEQIALFRLPDDALYAIANLCPFSNAQVMSRGIVGSKGGVAKVASPIFKQNFDLSTGACLDDPSVAIATYPVRVVGGRVEIGTS